MPGLIEDYALIGDMRSAALISRDGSVDWLCVPRFDSAACFAALLGDDRHGHWSIAPAAAAEAVDHMDDSPARRKGQPRKGQPRKGQPRKGQPRKGQHRAGQHRAAGHGAGQRGAGRRQRPRGPAGRRADRSRGRHGNPALPGRDPDPGDGLAHPHGRGAGHRLHAAPERPAPRRGAHRRGPVRVGGRVLRVPHPLRLRPGGPLDEARGGLPAGHRRPGRALAGHADPADPPGHGARGHLHRHGRRAGAVRAELGALA